MLLPVGVTVIVVHLARQMSHTRAVKEFVTRVSHDLRSPLTTVKLHLETVLLRDLEAEQRAACLDAAIQELGRLEGGIEDILTASRIERRQLQLTAQPLELGRFVSDFVDDRTPATKTQRAALAWIDAGYGPMAVKADPLLLRRALDNLVDNAIVHGPVGVEVRMELGRQAGFAVLAVTDNGPGLERRERKRVFRMFYRGVRNRRHRRGTGLGLFIVASIARAHGGSAWIDSPEDGRGCRVRMAIPLTKDEGAP